MEQEEKSTEKAPEKAAPKRRRPGPPKPRKTSRRHRDNKGKIEHRAYPLREAIELLQSTKGCNFNETIEISMKLGIDPKKSDQLVRGSVSLPKGIGKTVSVLVFAEGEIAEQAKAEGADFVGASELVEKIQNENWVDFDIAIAHPAMMKFVGRLGKVLGPKGKMPSPKAGTVTQDIATAVREFKSGRVEYRTDNSGNVHAPMGKKDFPADSLASNIETFVEHIKSVKPSTAKGTYVQKNRHIHHDGAWNYNRLETLMSMNVFASGKRHFCRMSANERKNNVQVVEKKNGPFAERRNERGG